MNKQLPISALTKAAHNVKTLLTLLQADVDRWQKSSAKRSGPANIQMVKEATAMYNHTQRLGDLLGSLLLDGDHVSPKIFDLNLLLQEVIEDFKQAFPQVEFAYSGETAFIEGVEAEICVALQNVFENALKYGQSHDTLPAIACFLVAHGKNLVITISDHGVGIGKQDLNKVFIPFYRGKNALVAGSGLGLAITRDIVLRHRGKITIKSSEGIGTSVVISFPIAS